MTATLWTPKRLARLAELIDQGLTYRQIARRMRVTRDSVKGAAGYYGLTIPERSSRGESWARADYDTLEQHIAAGLTYPQIAERMGRSRDAIRHATARIGLSSAERQRRRLNPHWAEMRPIIETCITVERMCLPQVHQRLTALGYQMSESAIHRAKAVSQVAGAIIGTAKVEVEYAKATGQSPSSDFLPVTDGVKRLEGDK